MDIRSLERMDSAMIQSSFFRNTDVPVRNFRRKEERTEPQREGLKKIRKSWNRDRIQKKQTKEADRRIVGIREYEDTDHK